MPELGERFSDLPILDELADELDAAFARDAHAHRRWWRRIGRGRPRWRPVLATGVLVAVIAALLVALLPGRVDSPVVPAQAQAARLCLSTTRPIGPDRCLRALADVAAAQRGLAAGKVFYERNLFTLTTRYVDAQGRPQVSARDAAWAIVRSVSEEIWLAPDGSGRITYGPEGPARPAGPADEAAWRAAGSPDLDTLMGPPGRWGPKTRDYPPGELDRILIFNSSLEKVLPARDPLSVLPRDPQELARFLQRAARTQRPEGPLSNITNTFGTDVTTFLRYPRTPPRLRTALLQVLATIPGARLLGEVRDGAGRPAAAIKLPVNSNDGNSIVAFDPATSRLLAAGSSDGHAGVRWHRAYAVVSAAVDDIGQRP